MARAKAVLETTEAPPRRAATRTAATSGRARTGSRRRSNGSGAVQWERKFRQTVRRFDLWTVLKISICFYLTGLIVTLLSGAVLWWIASAAGVIGDVEKFLGDLVEDPEFKFLSWTVLQASTFVGLVLVCVMVVMTVLAAAFYNLFSELVGGVEITVVEDERLGA